jgi:HEAT repeat protein
VQGLVGALVALEGNDSASPLFELIEHKNVAVRTRAGAALQSLVRPEHEIRTLELARSRRSESRQVAARLLGQLATQGSARALLDLCGDASSAVASAAVQAIATHAYGRVAIEALERAIASPPNRTLGYLCLALSAREEQLGELVPGELSDTCLRAIDQPDPFVAAAAAVALSSIGFRSADVANTKYLESKVVPALVVAGAGERFFPDFTSVHDFATRRLAVLTNRSFGENGPAWSRWWNDNKTTFRANRAAFAIARNEITSLAMDVELPSGKFTLRGELAEPGPWILLQEEYLLTPDELQALATSLEKSRLTEPTILPGMLGARGWKGFTDANDAGAHVGTRLCLRDRTQRKAIGRADTASWPELDSFLATCVELRTANLWQRYRSPILSSDRDAFLASERAFLGTNPDANARAAHAFSMIVDAFPSLGAERRVAAIADLRAIPGLDRLVDERAAIRLSAFVGEIDPRSEAARNMLSMLALSHAKSVLVELSHSLESVVRSNSRPLLESAFRAFGPELAREFLKEPRAWVRAAAATSLGDSTDPSDIARLASQLSDPSEDAVLAALVALGRRRDATAVEAITAAMERGSVSVQRTALAALGQIAAPAAVEAIIKATSSEDATIRRAALTALGEARDPRTADLVANYWLRTMAIPGANIDEANAAREALFRIGGDKARDALRRCYDSAPQGARRMVAISLAEFGDPVAIPALIAEYERSADGSLRNAILATTCVDFFAGPDAVKQYRQWWTEHRGSSPSSWFLAACQRSKLATDLTPEMLDSTSDLRAIPSLTDVLLRAEEWYLRIDALRWLRSITGKSYGEVDRATSPEERARIAAEYRKLLETRK